MIATLVLAPLLVSVHSFGPVATRQSLQWESQHFASSINDDDGRVGKSLNLPPGRRTPRFVSFLFDDSLRLLNPKTMGSYQTKMAKRYGDVFKTNIFGKPTIFVTSEETVKLLGKEEARTRSTRGTEAFFPPHHQSLFGFNSLLVQSGETHDRLRRLIQPSLSANLMDTVYQPIVEQAVDDFLSGLPSISSDDDGYIELVPHLRSFFISIALRILLGKSREVPSGMANDLTIWSKGLLAAPLTFIPWSTAAKAQRARKRICQAFLPLIQQERMESSQQDSKKVQSLLGRLVSAVDEETGNNLSDDDILDNVLTLIFAGSDTTASAATSLWMALSLHPDLKKGLKNSNRDQAELLVEAVLRAYPPAPFSLRLAKESLSVRAYDIPAGWLVVYGFAGALAAKQDKEGGLDSLVVPSTVLASNASASTAFGAGPRMCPGRYLAVLELTTLGRKLVEKYDWRLKPDQNLQQTYTPGFFPKDGLKVKFEGQF